MTVRERFVLGWLGVTIGWGIGCLLMGWHGWTHELVGYSLCCALNFAIGRRLHRKAGAA